MNLIYMLIQFASKADADLCAEHPDLDVAQNAHILPRPDTKKMPVPFNGINIRTIVNTVNAKVSDIYTHFRECLPSTTDEVRDVRIYLLHNDTDHELLTFEQFCDKYPDQDADAAPDTSFSLPATDVHAAGCAHCHDHGHG